MATVHNPHGKAKVVLLCEHASNQLPPEMQASDADRPWLESHWGWDPGAAALTLALSRALDAPAVLGETSRLVCDLNRPPGDPTWIRTEVEGHRLSFNASVDEGERARRASIHWLPYHAAVDQVLAQRTAGGQRPLVFSIHTFTALYLGVPRTVELGVLFDEEAVRAEALRHALAGAGFDARLNEPWSGKEGLIYSPDRHARAHRLPCLEVEVRNDLLGTPRAVESLARLLAASLPQ
jgi:predicted N-formylglutamate amidohydrolase